MTTQSSPRTFNFEPRSLPIALKIALGLGFVLIVSGFITSRLASQVVDDAQTEIVQNELRELSQEQALNVVDAVYQEIAFIDQFSANDTVQDILRLRARTSVGGNPDTLQSITPLYGELSSFDVERNELIGATLVDSHGIIVATTLRLKEEILPDPGDWSWYQTGMAGGYMLNALTDDSLFDLAGIHLSAPVIDEDDSETVLGVIYVIWNLSNIPDVTKVRSREDLLFTLDGDILLSPTTATGVDLPADFTEEVRRQDSGNLLYTEPDGTVWRYGYTHFSLIDEARFASIVAPKWVLATREPQAVTTASVAELTRSLDIAIFASSALVTLLVTGLAFLIVRPLQQLTSAAVQIGEGRLETEIPDLPMDEVGQLASTLKAVVEQLLNRLAQLRSAVQVSRTLGQTLEIAEMLTKTAQGIAREFDYPEVHIYLLDAGSRQAWLQSAAGDMGQQLIDAHHSLPVDENTVVGRAILLNEPQVGRDPMLGSRAARMRLPEVAVALYGGGRPLGALHVIADRFKEFDQEDISVLSLIGDQLSAAIQNARLFEQTRSNVEEIEALNRRMTGLAWQDFLREHDEIRHTRDPEGRWPEIPEAVLAAHEISVETYTDSDGRSVLAMPLILRGESIGTLAVTRPPGEIWAHEEVLLVEAVGSRLIMFAEGLRLLEESSLRAAREQTVNEVSASLLRRAASVDGVLQTALEKLSGVLGSDNVSLRIGRPPADDDGKNGQGDSGSPANPA